MAKKNGSRYAQPDATMADIRWDRMENEPSPSFTFMDYARGVREMGREEFESIPTYIGSYALGMQRDPYGTLQRTGESLRPMAMELVNPFSSTGEARKAWKEYEDAPFPKDIGKPLAETGLAALDIGTTVAPMFKGAGKTLKVARRAARIGR